MTFTIGQRWISNAETSLGLGTITNLQGRHISVSFPAADETRIYATENAPLSRIIFKIGEIITTNDESKIRITALNEDNGYIIYSGIDESGQEVQVKEFAIGSFIELNTPEVRLLAGLVDKLNAYKLRIETLNNISRLQTSPVKGLLGSRTNHHPHQIYIANEVAQRHAPRVLLADEVGLGKTIEAGMILHYQLHTGKANRVLIVVPDTLIHQWLVEMRRRFNLYFSIIDQNSYDAAAKCELDFDEYDDEYTELRMPETKDNLFESAQLILCGLDFLVSNDHVRQQAIETSWDLLVVDEAHHLHWSPHETSYEYQCIENLSAQSNGLLLLTATPEQTGMQSHFARLRLLDPSRFYDLNEFIKEEERYQEINTLIEKLIEHQANQQTELTIQLKEQIQPYLPESNLTNIDDIIKNLLDRHGTGRVLFRNTRFAIKGFPERQMHSYPLPKPAIYAIDMEPLHSFNLFPEMMLEKELWLQHDPRVVWLMNHLESLKPQKILVICAHAKTAIALEQHLKLKAGIKSTSFHESLTIIDRDKAAAYFAEEDGAQVLVCSEIGSEGRNFQFARHLVLFDLPLNPDLLEQRIGRLDRIGQRYNIQIYVPYLLNTAQEILFRWYQEGISLFENSCSVGFSIYEAFQDRLHQLLEAADSKDNSTIEALIKDTKDYAREINQKLHAGRNKLLELNSCNLPKAQELIAGIEAEENYLELENYMAKVFHEYGVDHNYHSEYAEVLHPTDHMKTTYFPGLKEDGLTITYSRAKALVREDMEFLSWEHPMVNESMEMILGSTIGSATLTTISVKSITPGTIFLESFYTVNCSSPKELQLDLFLPLKPIRILMDIQGKNLSSVLDYDQLNGMCAPVKRQLGLAITKQIRNDLETILEQSNKVAAETIREIVEHGKSEMKIKISQEIDRLEALQKINPSVRTDEILFLKQQIIDSESFINTSKLKLQAVRVVINS